MKVFHAIVLTISLNRGYVMRAANADLRIAIKADATTPYSVIKNVMNSLQDLRENRYNLITSLKAESEN